MISEFLGSIWWLLVALGLLITFHEFGHFWVAKRMGVRVIKFSIGFGKALWSRKGRDGTEYAVAAIPLGGYVKMLDERETTVREDELDQAFNRKPVLARITIVIAGPAFNLLFTLLAFWVMFIVGIPESRPIIGATSGIAASAGLHPGDRILSVDGTTVDTWQHTLLNLVTHAIDRDDVTLRVEARDGVRRSVDLNLHRLGDNFREEDTLKDIGITPWRLKIPAIVGEVSRDSPAARAGIRPGDKIKSIAGEPVPDWSWIGALVQKHGSAGQILTVTVERGGTELELGIRPEEHRTGLLKSRLLLGIANQPPTAEQQAALKRAYFMHKYNPLESIKAAASEMWRLTHSTLGVLGRMLTGSASVRNLSGPISIAQFANSSANAGLSSFLYFLAAISLSLGILNLLPIPVLDGGHLLFYLIELLKGSPVSEQVQANGQYIGLVALLGLMGIAFFNDILRLVG